MVANEHAALRLAHPTVVPGESDDEPDEEAEPTSVDVTGSHPTVRATPIRSD